MRLQRVGGIVKFAKRIQPSSRVTGREFFVHTSLK